MNLRARIGLLVQAQGAKRAAQDIDGVARPVRRIGTETELAGRKFRRAEVEALSFRKGLIGMTSFVSAGAVGIFGLGAVLHGAATEYEDAFKAGRATNAVLASTGGIANVTQGHVEGLANSLSMQAGVDDELIQKGENLLLTFRNIRNEAGAGNDIFDQTTQAALDMSAAFTAAGKNMDVASAALQLGKALNDPTKGMSRLQRVGVSFTQSQIDQAKALQKNGDLLGAQRIILAELTKEFGGAAKATASPIDRANVAWKNLEETLGRNLAPTVETVLNDFAGFATEMDNGTGAGGKFAAVLGNVWDGVKGIYSVGKDLLPVLIALVGVFAAYRGILILTAAAERIVAAVQLVRAFVAAAAATDVMTASMVALDVALDANPVVLIAAALVGLAVGLVVAYHKVKWFHDAVHSAWAWISKHWRLLVDVFAAPAAPIILMVTHFRTLKSIALSVFKAIKGAVHSVVQTVKDAVGWVGRLIDKIESLNPFHTTIKAAVGVAHTHIPGLASGGDVTSGGVSVIGENGPELLELPTGARVSPLPSQAQPVSLAQTGNGRTVRLEIPVYLDGRKVGNGVRKVALGDLLASAPA